MWAERLGPVEWLVDRRDLLYRQLRAWRSCLLAGGVNVLGKGV